MDGSLLGNSLVSGLVAQCDAWPKGKRADDFHQPLASDVPALLMSGELDPVTTPAYAERVVKTPPNRSEERRVGKDCVCSCRSRWLSYHTQIKYTTQHPNNIQ